MGRHFIGHFLVHFPFIRFINRMNLVAATDLKCIHFSKIWITREYISRIEGQKYNWTLEAIILNAGTFFLLFLLGINSLENRRKQTVVSRGWSSLERLLIQFEYFKFEYFCTSTYLRNGSWLTNGVWDSPKLFENETKHSLSVLREFYFISHFFIVTNLQHNFFCSL